MELNDSSGTQGVDPSKFTTEISTEQKKPTDASSSKKEEEVVGVKKEGFDRIFPGIVESMERNFPAGAFILVTLGYIVIETFSERGVDFLEYLVFILIVVIAYSFLKIRESENGLLRALNSKKWLIAIIFIVVIDTIVNHFQMITMIVQAIKTMPKQ